MNMSTRGGGCAASHALFASTSDERSRVRLKNTSDSAPAAIHDVSAAKKITPSAKSNVKPGAGIVLVARQTKYRNISASVTAAMNMRAAFRCGESHGVSAA